jgi:hypothetical protein
MSGRTSNNKSFVALEGNVSGTVTTSVYTGVGERSLPDRKKVKTIFVERFSAPGGVEASGRGVLNRESEEFSPYNTVNYRNLKVRSYLRLWEAESASLDSENPSYHKVNKNRGYQLDGDGNVKTVHDNEHIVRQIPRSDAQYSWVSSSYINKPSTSGYVVEGYSNIDTYNTSSFQIISASQFAGDVINHAGLNIGVLKDIDLTTNTVSPVNIGVDINKFLANIGGKFKHPTWKQIRNGNNKIVDISKKNNKILVQNIPEIKTKINVDALTGVKYQEQYKENKSPNFTSYIEPPVSYNKPMTHTVLVSGSESPVELVSSYDNNKNKFSNSDLATRLGVKDREESQLHDILVDLSENGTFEPRPEIEKTTYSQVLFPESTKAGLNIIRSKPNYAEEAGTGSNGYDRNVAEIRSFWKDDVEDRKRTRAIDSSTKTGSINSLNYAQISSSFEKQFTANGFPISLFTMSMTYPFTVSVETPAYSSSILHKFYDSYSSINALDAQNLNVTVTSIFDNPTNLNIYTASYNNNSIRGELSIDDLYTIRKKVLFPSGTYSAASYLDESSNPFNFGQIFTYDNNYTRLNPHPQYSFDNLYPFGYYQQTYTDRGFNFLNIAGFKADLTYTNLKLNPFYNSYEDFFKDLKSISKKYSILPEYRINDSIEFYIRENNGNFSKPYQNYLNLDGRDLTLELDSIKTNYFNNFIVKNENNNKIKINISGIKKLLPYKGFYPSERTVQLADLFQKSLFDLKTEEVISGSYKAVNEDPDNYDSSCPLDQQILTLLQPFYAPGIMYNTIKSGIAVDWASVVTAQYELPYQYGYNHSLNEIYSTASINIPAPENLLNYTLNKEQNFRFPFETILDPTSIPDEIKEKILIYLNPSLYGSDIVSGSERDNLRIPSYSFKDLSTISINSRYELLNSMYKLAANNFFAEIPEFFLKNKTLTSFKSTTEEKFRTATSGKTYYMDVFLRKDKNFKQILTYKNDENGALQFNPGWSFGPRTRFFDTYDIINGSTFSTIDFHANIFPYFNDEVAFAPYLPPYYFGESFARLSFTADSSYITLQDILNNLKIEYHNYEAEKYFSVASSRFIIAGSEINFYNSPAYKQLMNISSSINFNNTFKLNQTKYDQYGKTIEIAENTDGSKNAWSIQTKFESPLLNFNNDINFINNNTSNDQYFTGLWAGSGSIPKPGESVQFGIRSSFNKDDSLTGSLIELCGFNTSGDISVKDIGILSNSKEISEMVVMIPYVEKGNENFNISQNAKNINGIIGEGPTAEFNKQEGPFYFAIDKEKINSILDTQFDSTTVEQLKKILETSNKTNSNSIAKQMKAMTEFNFPPHLDWITNKNVEPFVMYTFEFKHTLDQEDLSLIWQGVMPKIARTASLDDVTFEHSLGEDEFFHNKKLPDNIKFKIFKIKKKAKMSYYDLVEDVNADKRFKFEFAGGKTIPDYSYNYPYDFFSLVELVNVESTIESSKPEEITIASVNENQAITNIKAATQAKKQIRTLTKLKK